MAANRQYFKREGWIEVEGFDIPKGLDVKFEVDMVADITVDFKASVMGLSKEKCCALAQHLFWKNLEKPQEKAVRVYAGYDGSRGGTGAYKIAEGLLLEAYVGSPPSMWLDMKCMNVYAKNAFLEEEVVLEGLTVEELFAKIASSAGYVGRLFASSGCRASVVNKFTLRADPKQTINEFCEDFKFKVAVDGGALYGWHDETGAADLMARNGVEAVVDREHGLLQWTVPDLVGAKARCRLNREYRVCQMVDVESAMMPRTGGRMFVVGVKHVGHLRGDDWYTELDLLRTDFS